MSKEAEILTRCVALLAELPAGEEGDRRIDEAVADLHRLPVDMPARAHLAAQLVLALNQAGLDAGTSRLRHLDGLIAMADLHAQPIAGWPRVRSVARILSMLVAATELRLPDPRGALSELDRLAIDAGADPAVGRLRDLARAALTFQRAMADGDQSAVRRLREDFGGARQALAEQPAGAPLREVLDRAMDVMEAHQRDDGSLWHAMEQLQAATRLLPAGHFARERINETATALDSFRALTDDRASGVEAVVSDEQLAVLRRRAERVGAGDAERARHHAIAGGCALGAGNETNLGRVGVGIEHLRAAVALAPPDDPQRAFYLFSLALGLFRRSELTGSIADLDEAATVLDEACERAGGFRHPLWSVISDMRSHIQRRRSRGGAPGVVALEGLRANAWRVLIQPDTAAAAIAARGAAEEAISIARSLITDNNLADAIRALDAGRALMLYAATEMRGVTARLEAAGRADLARRWREASGAGAPERLAADLRQEVLAVLVEREDPGAVSAGLLEPPSLHDIRSALAALDADALVYLLPGVPPAFGLAVVAPAQGPPSYLALPNLHIERHSDVERYLAALSDQGAAGVPRHTGTTERENTRDLPVGAARSGLVDAVDAMCDWAWRAAIGPLVETYLPRLSAPASGRDHRLVLVPMGELARVPWHAARRPDGRYAVQLAAFSQAASARMLCASAASTPVPIGPVGLVVGDPDTAGAAPDLEAARLEAYAIHQAFYQGARYVGRRVDGRPSRSGPGTAGEVRDWLTSTSPAAGAMLHLACHAVLRAGPKDSTSYLLLAGGDRLTAEDLIGLSSRMPERAVGLVVLAACRSGVSVNGYDEAFSLGTAFLAGGVRSVLTTQWSVPDRATSTLMFMFHHYLMTERLPVWDALRRAQLWMLDPGRKPPRSMSIELCEQLSHGDLADVVAWAGFVHWGQ